MGLLSGFAAGASQGVMQGWAEIRDKTAMEAKMAFEERLSDKNYARARGDQLADREYTEQRQDTVYDRTRQDAISDEQRGIEQTKDLKSWEWENAPRETPDRWVDVVNEQGEVVNQRNTKTGALKWSAKDRGTGKDSEIKANLKPLSMGEGIEIPNVWIDTKSGYVVDPSGSLTKPTVDDETLKTQVDAEVKEMRGGVMGMGKKSDEQAFGTTEENYRKMRLEQLKAESPTLAQELGFDNGRVLRSEKELKAIYEQGGDQGVSMPGQQPVSVSGVTFDPSMFNDDPEAAQNKTAVPDMPGQAAQEKPVNQPKISNEERAALSELEGFQNESPENTPDAISNIQSVEAALGRGFDIALRRPKGLLSQAGKLTEDISESNRNQMIQEFFGGRPSVRGAQAVLENPDSTEKQKLTARAYLKVKGQQ